MVLETLFFCHLTNHLTRLVAREFFIIRLLIYVKTVRQNLKVLPLLSYIEGTEQNIYLINRYYIIKPFCQEQ
jgi:hypothetical protein